MTTAAVSLPTTGIARPAISTVELGEAPMERLDDRRVADGSPEEPVPELVGSYGVEELTRVRSGDG